MFLAGEERKTADYKEEFSEKNNFQVVSGDGQYLFFELTSCCMVRGRTWNVFG